MNIISGVPLTSEAYRRSLDAALIKREVAEYKEHPCGRATLTAQAHLPPVSDRSLHVDGSDLERC